MKPFTSWDVRFGPRGTLQGGNRAVEFLAGPDIPLLDLASELIGALSRSPCGKMQGGICKIGGVGVGPERVVPQDREDRHYFGDDLRV